MKLELSLLLTFAVAAPAFAETELPEATLPVQLLVDLNDDTTDADEQDLEAKLGGLDLKLNSINATEERFFVADIDPALLPDYLDALKNDPRVEHAELNYFYEMSMIPDDPMWDRQWSMQMIDMPEAWEHAAGEGVVVAVIDTGVAYENYEKFKLVEDLGGTSFVKGYDFVSDDDHANDDHGHGTHVAGTIAQTTNNGVGVAGIAYKAKIMPLKVLNRAGMGTAADIADAIRFAADEGAQVINMSLGGGGRSAVMESAVAYARKKNVVVVCAAGNGSRNRVEYPAAYPGAFAVSAVGPDKKLAFYSSYGKELAISAPGGDKQKGGDAGAILQNTIQPDRVASTNLYLSFQGTSMATPHVAGVAALVISAGVTDAKDVEEILKSSASDAGEQGWDEKYGAGILNAGRAVQEAEGATGGWKFLLAGLGSLVAFVTGLRRKLPGARFGFGSILGTILGASGLFFLSRLGVPGLGILAEPMPAWDGVIFGSGWRFTALWASAIPVVLATVALLSSKRLRGFLFGLSIGWGAHLILSAFTLAADVRFIPGTAGIFDAMWLATSGLILFALATLVAKLQVARR
jgi:serine protease